MREQQRSHPSSKRLAQYREARDQRTGGRRELSTRRTHSQERCRDEEGSADRYNVACGSGARTGAQRGSHEPGALDKQVVGSPGRRSSGQRTSHPKIGSGRGVARPALPHLTSASVIAKDMACCCFKRGEKTGLILLNLPTPLCEIWSLKRLKRQKLREAMRSKECQFFITYFL